MAQSMQIFPAASIGLVVGIDTMYGPAHSAPSAGPISSGWQIGQDRVGANYMVHRLLLAFDTSAVPAGAVILDARLHARIQSVTTADAFDVQIRKAAYLSPILANIDDDYDLAITAALDHVLCSSSDGGFVTSPPLDLSYINRGGLTTYSLVSSVDAGNEGHGTAPTGHQGLVIDSPSDTYQPYLEISYEEATMAKSLSGGLSIRATSTLTDTEALRSAPATAALNAIAEWANGTAAGQADLVYDGVITVTNGASTTLDLTALTDAFGAAVNIKKVKGLVIKNTSGTRTLTVGGAATPLETDFLGGTTPTLVLAPGVAIAMLNDAGWGTTSHKNLQIAADGSTGTTDVQVWIIGTSA